MATLSHNEFFTALIQASDGLARAKNSVAQARQRMNDLFETSVAPNKTNIGTTIKDFLYEITGSLYSRDENTGYFYRPAVEGNEGSLHQAGIEYWAPDYRYPLNWPQKVTIPPTQPDFFNKLVNAVVAKRLQDKAAPGKNSRAALESSIREEVETQLWGSAKDRGSVAVTGR